ncbi:MAG: insulinase family protein [Bacteroides sp.]|nr:insulinase family protein [Bacteroides sp.]
MIRKIVSIAMCLMGMVCANAQMPQLTPLPLNPKVKHGVLPNGLSYYIMHNEEPKERANFYIAQKVGSTLETEDQLGLAHFLEHMAFNGTSHYPGKNMLNYLQSKGIRFGEDINAYTGFDETVYNINNVPTTDQNLMDSVLLVLHDWSGEILLEESEIDAERGVIREEWRSRNNANTRMYTAMLPVIYEEYQYHQMPIGSMDVVMNFKPEVLRAYYKKWYRPDQQGIVIVGDFDVDAMEAKVKELFTPIVMPENAAPRVYPNVSDNKEPIYFAFTDPELSQPRTTISFKSDMVPVEYRNTLEVYVNDGLVKNIISALINNRLSEYAIDPECDYAGAGVYFDNYYVSKTKDAFNIVAIPKNGNTQAAVADVMGIVARGCKTGFTDSELQRVKDELLSNYETMYNERDKTDTGRLANEIIRHFIDNEPAPGIETEYQLMQQILPSIPVDMINMQLPGLLTTENMVIVTSEPKQDGFEIVAEDVMLKTITDAMNAEYEAFVDEVITEPLIAQLPAPGKITNIEENTALGTTVFILSNGIKVVLKTTDFSADQIMMTAFQNGGKRTYNKDQADNINIMDIAFEVSKMGPFDVNTLRKYLTGKQVALGYSMNTYTNSLSGYSNVKDFQTLMELIYTTFTNLGKDQTTYDVMAERMKSMLAARATDPETMFFREVAKTRYENNPLMQSLSVENLEKANYSTAFDMIQNTLKNAADYTFIFTGNIDAATIRPLLEQYVATLPVAPVAKVDVVTPIVLAPGQVKNEYKQAMQNPATRVFDIYSGTNVPFNVKNDILVSLMGQIVDNRFVETLREEEGGTYGASVAGQMNPNTNEWTLLYYFVTNKEQQDQLIKRADAEFLDILNNGTDEVNFNKVKEAMIKQYEINVRTNGYWDGNLLAYERGYDYITGYLETLNSITLQDLNNFMKTLYNGKNRIQVIQEGYAAE